MSGSQQHYTNLPLLDLSYPFACRAAWIHLQRYCSLLTDRVDTYLYMYTVPKLNLHKYATVIMTL